MSSPEPIAIVGIGCRLPGGVVDPSSLWQLLRDGRDAITSIPTGRFDVDELYDERAATPGHIMSQWGGFIDGIDGFDAAFFEIAPRQAERLDPQQRLLLETSWEALEDAGVTRESIARTNAGVYVGMWTNEYESRMFADRDRIDFHMTTGTGRYAASGRLSYFFDLLGPSVTIDTACSSSLVSVHLAAQGLRNGECDLALAGGVNLIVEPFITIAYSQSRMMAPDGRCKFGDASADGYVRSDGAVMIALKRLSTAQAAGDHIYAVVRGSSVTNDGRTSGLLGRPGQAGQEEMLRRAYGHAGVDPRSVQYVEAHGTGTAAGDPVEFAALAAVVGADRDAADECIVGSIKSNIGHTEGAAGAAGLAKLALALEHGEIPASLHFEEPNPNIAWGDLGVRIAGRLQPWPAVDGPRRGGVSAYGIAGTNAHVVLEQAPPPAVGRIERRPRNSHLLAISASSPAALHALAERYADTLATGSSPIADLCAAAATRRSHLPDRLTAVGSTSEALAADLRRKLSDLDARPPDHPTGDQPGDYRVVFVFPGQGSQWPGMARELLADEPMFASAMARCDAAIRAEAGWSPLEMLTAADPSPQVDDIDIVQPLLFAVQVSLAALWASWGVTPHAVVGHSMGEVAAAHVAGALHLADATAVICRRSALLHRISGRGAMALVDLPMAAAAAAIAGHETSLSIAASNSSRSTVLSGDRDVLQTVLDRLQADDVFCRPVKVDVASHSPQVDPLLADLRASLAELAPGPTSIPFHSTVRRSVVDGSLLDAEYWAANLRQPVLFGDAIAELAAAAPTSFVELSPHPILLPSVEHVIGDIEPRATVVAAMRRGEPEVATMLAALGSLYEAGAAVDWPVVTGSPRSHVVLPTYPWQRQRHWYEPAPRRDARAGDHPLLGHAVRPAAEPGTVHWQATLEGDDLAFLRDHVVQGSAVLPATGFIELARAAMGEGSGVFALADIALHVALPIDADHPRQVQVTVEPSSVAVTRCRVWSREALDESEWQLHAEMHLGRAESIPGGCDSPDTIRARCTEHHDADAHVADMADRQLGYAGSFRQVVGVWTREGEALGRIDGTALPHGSTEQRIAVLDNCVQVALAALPAANAGQTFVPVGVQRVLLGSLDDVAWSHVRVRSSGPGRATCDLTASDTAGRVVAVFDGMQLQRVGSSKHHLESLLFEVAWRPAPLPLDRGPGRESRRWAVYAAGGEGDHLVALLRDAGDECVVVRPGSALTRLSDDEFQVAAGSVDDHRSVLADVVGRGGPACAGVVYAWGLTLSDDGGEAGVQAAAVDQMGCIAPIAIVQAIGSLTGAPTRLWLATRGAHSVVPAQALLWGVGRVAANEQPSLRCSLVDLDPTGSREYELFDEVCADAADQQVAYADGTRRVARLVRAAFAGRGAPRTLLADSYRVAATEPGSLDSLRPQVQMRRSPGADDVEVRVSAAALNFLDVLKAMGIYPGVDASASVALGAECAGVVVALGDAVTHVALGDEVVALTPSFGGTSMLASYVTVPAGFVQRRPPALSVEAASAAPVAYLTAFYALCELAGLRAGETVLVHSATGGVGLAALAVCRMIGAEVIATAGSPEKRDHLRSLGIEQVLDSRTTQFAAQIRQLTNGRGVDVVLNSLVGDAIPAGLSVLAPRGRFLEIGKRDVHSSARLDLAPFKNNLTLHVIDLAGLTEQAPEYVCEMLRNVIVMLAEGRLAPLPTTVTPIDRASDAFRTMARASHIGKLVLSVPAEPIAADAPAIRADATYLVTGGTGGLGLAVAERLVDRGARHLVLMARRPTTAGVESSLSALRDRGAEVHVVRADVSDAAQLSDALTTVRASMPPLRGVFHAAGVLADATIDGMDSTGVHAVLAPKVHGGKNLHESTLDDPLDHFVLFSSVAGVLGLSGQANYAAGNAFLDALAAHRRAAGLPACSIQWGPWAAIGLAASAENRGSRLAAKGLGSLAPTDALDVLDRVLDGPGEGRSAVAVTRFDAGRWAAEEPASVALLDEIVAVPNAPAAVGMTLRDRMLDVPAGPRRRRAIDDGICAELAPVLRVAVEQIDRHRPLTSMGLDSLLALELRNRLEHATGLTLPATVAWNYPTVTVLATHLAALMGVALDDRAAAADATTPSGDTQPEAAPSQADLEAMLMDELAAVDRLLDLDGGAAP